MVYKEIINIQNFIEATNLEIILKNVEPISEHLTPVCMRLSGNSYDLHVSDEYSDFNRHNPILNTIIVFRALAEINDSNDFLEWCKSESLNPDNPKLLSYYKDMYRIMHIISSHFANNTIDYFVSDLDFQLNPGVMQFLRG